MYTPPSLLDYELFDMFADWPHYNSLLYPSILKQSDFLKCLVEQMGYFAQQLIRYCILPPHTPFSMQFVLNSAGEVVIHAHAAPALKDLVLQPSVRELLDDGGVGDTPNVNSFYETIRKDYVDMNDLERHYWRKALVIMACESFMMQRNDYESPMCGDVVYLHEILISLRIADFAIPHTIRTLYGEEWLSESDLNKEREVHALNKLEVGDLWIY